MLFRSKEDTIDEGTWSSSKWSHPRPMNLSSGGGLDPEKKKALAARVAKYKPNMKAGESDEEYKARTAKNAAIQRAAVGMKEDLAMPMIGEGGKKKKVRKESGPDSPMKMEYPSGNVGDMPSRGQLV